MWGNYSYTSAADRKIMAQASSKKLEKKLGKLEPILITGRKIARSWWGKAWNDNIESYADYSNRLPRGRSYLKNGTLLHLAIEKNTVISYVQGNRKKPYEVTVNINSLNQTIKNNIVRICQNSIHSIQELLEGSFPKTLNEVFTKKGGGIFPTNKEIQFDCTCPDGAYLCKHVAATLYGISVKFDQDPLLFFKLRDININSLVSDALNSKSNDLFSLASKVKSKRIIKDTDIHNIFGIDLSD